MVDWELTINYRAVRVPNRSPAAGKHESRMRNESRMSSWLRLAGSVQQKAHNPSCKLYTASDGENGFVLTSNRSIKPADVKKPN